MCSLWQALYHRKPRLEESNGPYTVIIISESLKLRSKITRCKSQEILLYLCISFLDGPRSSLKRLRSQLASDGCPESQVVLAKQLLDEQCGNFPFNSTIICIKFVQILQHQMAIPGRAPDWASTGL